MGRLLVALASLLLIAATGGRGVATSSAAAMPAVSAGDGDSCALLADQTVWCWGLNIVGELGPGVTGDRTTPVRMTGVPAATAVSVGAHHSCVLDASSGVWCWGSDAFGELGNGTTEVSGDPTQILNFHATQVSAGDGFTCAVTLTATAACWGDNNYGELGNGTTTDASTPQPVAGLKNVVQVAAGNFHACALLSSGKVRCWGDNSAGELGNNTTIPSTTPVLTEAAGVKVIAAGADDTCAITVAGALECWGENLDGQLGNGSFTDSLLPAPVSGLSSGVTQVTMGESHTCALAGQVLCWGDPTNGVVGNGQFKSSPPAPVPTPVFGLGPSPAGAATVLQVAAGFHHSCVVLTTSQVMCWGDGAFGALGDGSTEDRAIPALTIGLATTGGAQAISVDDYTGCVVSASLVLSCWGIETGNGDTAMHTNPVPNLQGQVAQVSTWGGGCSVTPSAKVRCWGENAFGELGNGTHGAATGTPSAVPGLTGVQQISYGDTHVCVVLKGGGVDCWGANSHGQLGDGSTTERDSPTPVAGLPAKAVQVSNGTDYTCALLKNTNIWCWGSNGIGELGNGTTSDSSTPVPVSGVTSAVQIATGDAAACALLASGGVECWGSNAFGQLGDGTTTSRSTAAFVSGLTSGVRQILENDVNGCALLSGTGGVQCWGDDTAGQLGNSTTSTTPSLTPVTVTGFSSGALVITADATAVDECLLTTAGQPQCWGDNSSGQLGNGTTTAANSPQPVSGF